MTVRTPRLLIRTAVLVLGVALATPLLPRSINPGTALLPSLSPFLGLGGAMAARKLTFWVLLCLPTAVFALYHRRWFCRNLCPVGLMTEIAGKTRKRPPKHYPIPRIGTWLAVLGLGGAVVGYPLFLWLDPLAIFNSCAGSVNTLVRAIQSTGQAEPGPFSLSPPPVPFLAALPGIGLIGIVLISFWQPNLWCHRLCPLGAIQDLLSRIRHHSPVPLRRDRRVFLAAVTGGAVGLFSRPVITPAGLIRPPGVMDENRLTALCSRCGNCVRVCPQKIIQPDLGVSGIAGFLTPRITIGPKGYCSETCHECTRVCPTGAIAHLSLKEKQCVSIGKATVRREHCRPWAYGAFCRVCVDQCPYRSISLVLSKHQVPAPVVDPEVCRGCGLCQTVCPAEETAIRVSARPQQVFVPANVRISDPNLL